jgi:hypothetical protein
MKNTAAVNTSDVFQIVHIRNGESQNVCNWRHTINFEVEKGGGEKMYCN